MRRLPLTLPLGLILIAACEALLYVDVQNRGGTVVAHGFEVSQLDRPTDALGLVARWVAVNMTPLCWAGYVLALDGLLVALSRKRLGEGSPIRRRPNRFVVAWLTSVPVWCFFDWINFWFMDAWRYHGLPTAFSQRVVGYFIAFATITPGMFLTAEVVARLLPPPRTDEVRTPRLAWTLILAPWLLITLTLLALLPIHPGELSDVRSVVGSALLLLAAPLAALYRTRCPLMTSVAIGLSFLTWTFLAQDPLANFTLWTGVIYLLDPINKRFGAPSLIGDWQAGRWQRSLALGVGGLVCGFLWEFWNYWALAKWSYHLPFLGPLEGYRYFEMPLPGLLGFIPFAAECWVALNTIVAALQRMKLNVAEPLPDPRAIL